MRDRLTFLWNLQRSPDRRVRWGWYLTVLVMLLVVIRLPWLRNTALFLAVTASTLLCAVAVVWALFHPRSVFSARKAVWRWAVGSALITVVGGYAGALQVATSQLTTALPTAGVLSVILILLPFLLGLLFLYGWLGAAVSAWSERHWPDRDRLTRVGVNVWWLLTFGYIFAIGTSAHMAGSGERLAVFWNTTPLSMIPLLTLLCCRYARNPDHEPRRVAERLLEQLARYLTFRRRWRGRLFTVDLRGAALGLLVAAAVFGLVRPVLKAPSASLLVWMIQVRNQEAQGAWNNLQENDSFLLFGRELLEHDKNILAQRRKIVLIDLDAPVLRAAFAPSLENASLRPKDAYDLDAVRSEAALNALLIQRLHALGAAVIVLTTPQERPEPPSDSQDIASSGATTLAERERSKRDEPQLVEAIRKAENVVLTVPGRNLLTNADPDAPTETPGTSFSALIAAAQVAGQEQLVSYGSVRLPVLESGGKNEPTSLPIFIAQLYARLTGGGSYGFKSHTLAPVDFSNAKPNHDFLHIASSTLLIRMDEFSSLVDVPWQRFRERMQELGLARLLSQPPNDDLILTPDGDWKRLQESVRGRLVFLDTPVPHTHDTPLGLLPAREVLAYATATVLAREQGLRVATKHSLLLTLLIGTIMGALCAHRTPFEAAGRLITMSALILFASLACYMMWTLWLDAVTPLVAILLTYLLVTQLAFTQERERNRDLLKRFVAPEFVDAMLDHPLDRLGLSGKLSNVCVLFADVRNFTGFAERHTPEQVFEAVNQYMTGLTNALHAHGGVLDKYTGDGLMAWFPAEENARLQIEKAVKASLAMRDAALEISRVRLEQEKPALHFGIGMHYGEAMIGLVGNEEHQINYTALGHAVIVSARLQSLAAGGEVIISQTIYEAIAGEFRVEAREPVAVKGIHALVRPYHVLSA